MKLSLRSSWLSLLAGAAMLATPAFAQAPSDSTFWAPGSPPAGDNGSQSPGGGGSGGGAANAPFTAVLTAPPLIGDRLTAALREAKPIELRPTANPAVDLARVAAAAAAAGAPQAPKIVEGSPPQIGQNFDHTSLIAAQAARRTAGAELAPAAGSVGRMNFGSLSFNSAYHYTDSEIMAPAYTYYPHSAIGHLVFTLSPAPGFAGGTFRCTASLISRSIVVTAGHCAHYGGTGGAAGSVTAATYVPICTGCATGAGTRPFNEAPATHVAVSGGWIATGALNAGVDIAVYGIAKRTGFPNEMGSYTGTLGFCSAYCLQNLWYLTAFGYPGNYDNGNWLIEGQAMVLSGGADYTFGTGMEGGASGGPFISNWSYGPIDSSANPGQYTTRNVVFATRSWGYNNAAYKIGGSTALSGTGVDNLGFKGLYNFVCGAMRTAHGVGSCNLLP